MIHFPASVTSKRSFVTSTVVYDPTVPIYSKMFIQVFISFVCELHVDQFLAGPTILPCNWVASPFVNKDNDQILTVDLRIIK